MQITIPGEPISKARPRVGKGGFIYTPKKSQDHEKYIASIAKKHFKTPYSCPVSVSIAFFFNPPKTIKHPPIFRAKRPDIDNLIKTVLDALNTIAYTDDKLIVSLYSKKYYSPNNNERTIIEIIPIKGEHNEK